MKAPPGDPRLLHRALTCLAVMSILSACSDSPVGYWKLDKSSMRDTAIKSLEKETKHVENKWKKIRKTIEELKEGDIRLVLRADGTYVVTFMKDEDQSAGGTWKADEDTIVCTRDSGGTFELRMVRGKLVGGKPEEGDGLTMVRDGW